MHTIKKFFKIWLVIATVLAAIGISSFSCYYVDKKFGENMGVILLLLECSVLGAAFWTAINRNDNND